MTCNSNIQFRNVDRSEALEARIQEKIAQLSALSPALMTCNVMVDMPSRHHQHGNQYEIGIQMTVPGSELVVSKVANEDVYAAAQTAFDAARRKVQEFEASRRDRRQTSASEA